jgi:CheY-like chemotaxis protein
MTPASARLLIADDQADIVSALKLLLGDEGFDVVAAGSPDDVIEKAEASEFDLALIDLNYTRDTTSRHDRLEQRRRRG